MDDFKFSVAMCVYAGDDADNFDAALNSVYDQTLIPNEVVLTVDGPVNDAIDSVIKKYENQYGLKVHRLKENMGHGNARRDSLAHCTYDLVAIADADDINVSTRFEKQIKYFKEDFELSAVSSGCFHFSKSINCISNKEYFPISDFEIKKYMRKRCPLCQASAMLKKQDVIKAGGYQDWFCGEDYYLWIRMALVGAKFANSSECLIYVRSNDEQIIRRGGIKYYRSMKALFKFMLDNKIIGIFTYWYNCFSRFILQVLMPSKLRAFVRKKLL